MTNINSYNLVREHLYPHINSGNMLLHNEKINKILQNELDNNYVSNFYKDWQSTTYSIKQYKRLLMSRG